MLGYDRVLSTRHGGMEHQYWKEKVAAKLREWGYTVQDEYPIGEGKTVDLVASKKGKSMPEATKWSPKALARPRRRVPTAAPG